MPSPEGAGTGAAGGSVFGGGVTVLTASDGIPDEISDGISDADGMLPGVSQSGVLRDESQAATNNDRIKPPTAAKRRGGNGPVGGGGGG
ncbi:MAG: hypothetical protein ACO3JG_16380, partial [Luteolibacter sp.]